MDAFQNILMGFSVALATANPRAVPTDEAPLTAQPRALGSGLAFSNPYLLPGQNPLFPGGGNVASDPQGFDLGDAAFGSQIVRYVSALRGVTPYIFTSSDTRALGLSLDSTGRVSGILPVSGSSPVSFTAAVTDATGATRTGIFSLNTAAPGVFRFAQDRLPGAQAGLDYIANLETLGSDQTRTDFSVVPGSVTLNGAALSGLEAVGLALNIDGTLFGRPFASGTLAFTARAVYGASTALNRAGTAPDQNLAIGIAPEAIVQSVLATQKATITAGKPGKDSLSLQASVNTDGLFSGDFANETFTLRLASSVFWTQLDSNGQSKKGNLRVTLKAPSGTLKVNLKNQDFTALFGALPDQSLSNQIVQIQIGANFLSTEALQFGVQNKKGKAKLTYALKKNIQLGGLFQMTDVLGRDTHLGTEFKIKFLFAPAQGSTNAAFGTPTQATVYIGPGFVQTVSLYKGKDSFPPDGLSYVKIDTKNKNGIVETYPLSESLTGIPPSRHTGGTQQTLLFGIDLFAPNQVFSGDSSLQLLPF